MAKTYTKNACAWVSKDKNGKPYISFKAERDIKEGESINLFKNDKGDNPARPDYRSFNVIDDEVNNSADLTDEEMDSIPV
jgi:hypothetical protein